MTHSYYERCKNNDPRECFRCPYPDCVATMKDINRQEAERDRQKKIERNKHIVDLWNAGMPQKIIAEKLNMPVTTVQSAIVTERKKGKMQVRK